jgi:DMSO/TMAO reductase YedYZ molybdopterin-dependent catalytic subunit
MVSAMNGAGEPTAAGAAALPGHPALPPGQRPAELRRFGLPPFAGVRPRPSADPVVTVTGAVRHPAQLRAADLTGLPDRRDQRSDLHCVTTWSAVGLDWQGVPFAAVHELLAEVVRPHPAARWVVVVGLDGYRSCLHLDDALADDVLLADGLAGSALTVATGGPVRLVTPRLYGYKSVRHVCGIEYRLRYEPGSAGWMGHPRGRVDREERSRLLPGRVWRPVWRALQPRVRRVYAGAAARVGN